jgi:sugar/nucleoside kinase (ribokinase family)
MDLLIVGSVAFDTITTPFGKEDNALGGSATYFSLAARFFAKPGIVAVVGEDFNKHQIFKNNTIDVEGLETAPGKSFRWGGEYSFDLNNRTTLFTELNVFEKFDPKLPESYKTSEYIFLGNIHPSLQQKVLKQVKSPKLVGLDTMNFWIEGASRELLETLKLIDVLIINDSEARELTKEHNLIKAAKKIQLLMRGAKNIPPTVVIKRGEYGVLMFQNKNWFFAPGFPLEDVYDPTGAGDSFAGGFMGYLAKQKNTTWNELQKACVFGSVMGSFCVEKMGTERLQSLKEDKIKNRYTEFKRFTHFDI